MSKRYLARFCPTSCHDWSDGVARTLAQLAMCSVGKKSNNSACIGTPNGLEHVIQAQAPKMVLQPGQPEDRHPAPDSV